MIEFKPIANQDRDSVYEGYKAALSPLIEKAFGWNEDFQQERFQSRYELEWFHWITMSGERVGYVCFSQKTAEIHLSLLIIDADKRGRGLGQLVMTRLHELARESGSKVTLSSFKNNTGAIKFYERLGYKTVGSDEHFVDMVLGRP